MAKLIFLAFTIATLLAFASAHKTIVTTTIEDDIERTSESQQYCSQHLQGQQLRQCQNYLQQPEQTPYGQQQQPRQQQTLQQCCNELRNVNEPCVCQAVKKMFGNVQQQQQQQYQQEAGRFGSQQIQQVKQRAQNLPQMCNIQTREQQCNIKTGQQCRQEIQGRQQFNRCQRYLEQQTGSGYLRSAVQRQPEYEVEQCCEELRNVDTECQCEAMKEVYNQAQEEQRPTEMREVRRIVENLKNQCNLPVEYCRIPSRRF